MDRMLDRVRETIRRHDLARRDTRVVIALSGGSDSVALAYLLRELDAAGELSVAGVAHFNHQLRRTAGRDEDFSRMLATKLGWPVLVEREDVAARARDGHRSIEDAAHTARHAFFERARVHFSADVVAVGHTRDDQAETFLLRLVRGAGPKGLSSMHPRNGTIIRPLVDCRRQELREHLEALGVDYVEDETNSDVAILRNRVRVELLPLLESRFNPSIVDVLAGEAELARRVWEWMQSAIDNHQSRVKDAELDIPSLATEPIALQRLVIWQAMNQASGQRSVSFNHVDSVLRLIRSAEGGSVDMPGHRVERVGDRLVLTGRPADAAGRVPPEPRTNLFRYPLSIPGEVRLAEAGCVVSAEAAGVADIPVGANASNAAIAFVRGDLCKGSLAVRNRRPGDRFRPVGVGGTKKLQDFFIDRKVARHRRDGVPLVVDESDRIVWVAGYGIDEAFRITDASQAVLILRLTQA